jgi:hypothetical protein
VDMLVNTMARSRFYIDREVNPNLTIFPTVAFREITMFAGLREPFGRPKAADEPDDGLAHSRAAFAQLQQFEVAVRRFIEEVMSAAFGDSWMKHQLPSGMLDRWMQKREIAIKTGEGDRPLIDFSDFTDYKAIIERTDNWKRIFKQFFGRPEDVRESFQRLYPVRIATMHARIVTLDDKLLLMVETKRVLRAIRRSTGGS